MRKNIEISSKKRDNGQNIKLIFETSKETILLNFSIFKKKPKNDCSP